jgi:hypothetical protein
VEGDGRCRFDEVSVGVDSETFKLLCGFALGNGPGAANAQGIYVRLEAGSSGAHFSDLFLPF